MFNSIKNNTVANIARGAAETAATLAASYFVILAADEYRNANLRKEAAKAQQRKVAVAAGLVYAIRAALKEKLKQISENTPNAQGNGAQESLLRRINRKITHTVAAIPIVGNIFFAYVRATNRLENAIKDKAAHAIEVVRADPRRALRALAAGIYAVFFLALLLDFLNYSKSLRNPRTFNPMFPAFDTLATGINNAVENTSMSAAAAVQNGVAELEQAATQVATAMWNSLPSFKTSYSAAVAKFADNDKAVEAIQQLTYRPYM